MSEIPKYKMTFYFCDGSNSNLVGVVTEKEKKDILKAFAKETYLQYANTILNTKLIMRINWEKKE